MENFDGFLLELLSLLDSRLSAKEVVDIEAPPDLCDELRLTGFP